MLTILKAILKLIKKEQSVLLNYRHSHPHFIFYIFFDIIVSAVLIFGGFIFAASQDSSAANYTMLVNSGVIPMSYGELINHVRKDDRASDWLGYIPGNTYTLNNTIPNVYTITYYPQGTNPKDNLPHLMVQTFSDKDAFSNYHTILGPITDSTKSPGFDLTTIYTSDNSIIEFDKNNPISMKISFKDKARVILVTYPNRQDLGSLVADASKIVPVY